ncbi:hypothetical protein JOH51_000602 [Rhizobium leguminosarum]|nr:hypothetical protein [Rhizobium leguminosarum]
MSLTGLFCSIVFTVVFRRVYGAFLKAAHDLCETIEKKLTYISLEALASEQLQAIREQREHFRIIGMELVSELGRPLREELPKAISASISDAMAPMMDRVGKLGAEGVGDLVSGLSNKLTDTVGLALADASPGSSRRRKTSIAQLQEAWRKSLRRTTNQRHLRHPQLPNPRNQQTKWFMRRISSPPASWPIEEAKMPRLPSNL